MLTPNINLSSKTVLVTGAAGFIGANLVKRLFADVEDIRVVGLDSLNDYYDVTLKQERLREIDSLARNWRFVKGNLADKALVESLFAEEGFALVVNLAAQAGVRYSINVRYAIKAQCPYILHFVKDPARREDPTAISPFATISDAQMLDFRRMVGDADAPITIDTSTLRIGTKVRIKAGKLKGLTGYICRLPSSPAAVPAHPANA